MEFNQQSVLFMTAAAAGVAFLLFNKFPNDVKIIKNDIVQNLEEEIEKQDTPMPGCYRPRCIVPDFTVSNGLEKDASLSTLPTQRGCNLVTARTISSESRQIANDRILRNAEKHAQNYAIQTMNSHPIDSVVPQQWRGGNSACNLMTHFNSIAF